MAELKIPYPGLAESLKFLRLQVLESLPYVAKHTPRMDSPEDIFYYAKTRYSYKNDPPAVEFFQTVPTLLTDNEHFKAGEGDCDDATIFILSLLVINGFKCGYVLAGRNKYRPSHIYAYCDFKGKRFNLDLTNKKFNQIRNYPFKQFIPFKINQKQLDMYLQLADGQMPKYKIRRLSKKEKENSIYIPSKSVFIPVETFDKLPNVKISETLLAEGYSIDDINTYLSGRAQRRERRAMRQEFKKEKKKEKIEKRRAKTEIKKARAEKKRATGEARKLRGEAKIIKAERQEGEGKFQKFVKTAIPAVKQFIQPEEEQEQEFYPEQEQQEEFYPEKEQQEEFYPEEEQQEEELSEGFAMTKKEIATGILFLAGIIAENRKFV